MCAKAKDGTRRMPLDYCTIACNTIGYDKSAPLVEVAAVRVRDGRAVEAFRSYISTLKIVSDNLRKNANITDRHLKGAPALDEAMSGLLDFIGDDLLVGAKYGRFIKPYIERDALAACGVVMENEWRDVLWKADGMGLLSRDSLTDLCEHLKIKKDAMHRAITDAVATWQCWEAMRLIDQGTEVKDLPDWIYHGDVPLTSLGPDTDAEIEAEERAGRLFGKRVKWYAVAVLFAVFALVYVRAGVTGFTVGEMGPDVYLVAGVAFTALCVASVLRARHFRDR